MGLNSSLAAPSAPQFQSLMVKPVARATVGLMTPSPDSHTAAQKLRVELPTEAALRPILPPASSESIFNGLLPLQPALVQAAAADSGQIETLTEVDGISLDGIPYLRDGAVLLDDLPQAEPAPKAKPTGAALALVKPAARHPEIETQAEPEQTRTDNAERAYLDEREISALRAVPAVPADTPDSEQASPDQPDPIVAPSADQRA